MSKMEAYNKGQISKMISISYYSVYLRRLTHFLCLELEISLSRCLMCSCNPVIKNKEIQKLEDQTCNNLCPCLDFCSPSAP